MLQAIMDAKYHYLKHCLQINAKMTVNTALTIQRTFTRLELKPEELAKAFMT